LDFSKFKIAGYQMFVSADIDRNVEKIAGAMEAAAANGTNALVLPECAISGYPPLHHKAESEIDHARIEAANKEMAKLCRDHGLWLIAGTMTRRAARVYNTALVISPEGKLIGRYDKLHLTEEDKEWFTPGKTVPVFDFGGAVFAALICLDTRFPEPFRYLKSLGAAVVFTIFNACGGATWKVPVLEGTFRCRAAENNIYVVAVNAAGPLQMAVSRICDPDGLSLAEADMDKEEMIYAVLDLPSVGEAFYGQRRADVFEVVYRPKRQND